MRAVTRERTGRESGALRRAGESGIGGLCHDTGMPAAAARRQRLDQLLVERGLAETRSRAQALVMAGRVRVGEGDGARTDRKAGDLVARDAAIAVAGHGPCVSRGGHKLLAALDAFEIDPAGLVAWTWVPRPAASPTSCCAGAARVYALDVGTGQLAEKLRRDPRVVVAWSATNARTLTPGTLPEPVRPGRHRRLVHLAGARPRRRARRAARRPAARSSRW